MEELYAAPAGVAPKPLPEIDVSHLRAACESCGTLRVASEEGGDWSVALVGRHAAFVDVHSVEDTYPAELWAAADAYFRDLSEPDLLLPGGRYACAQALLGRKLEFLAGFSLGQVCHIVQLAISERKLLGYCNGTVVPYGRSQSMMKERCAEQQQPCGPAGSSTHSGAEALQLANWEVARAYLKEILEEAAQPGQGPAVVPLSNIKRVFRSRYCTELSETALGHARMADLLQDERFQDLCTLRLQRGGYVVVAKEASPPGTTISLAETLRPQPLQAAGEAVISLADELRLSSKGGCEATEARSAVRSPGRPLSLELCLREAVCSEEPEPEAEEPAAPGLATAPPLSLPLATPLPSPGAVASTTIERWLGEPHRLRCWPNETLRFEDGFETGDFGAAMMLPTPLPSPGEPASATVRRWAGVPHRAEFFPEEVAAAPALATAGAGATPAATDAGGPQPPPQLPAVAAPSPEAPPLMLPGLPQASAEPRRWCPGEPLCLEEAGGLADGSCSSLLLSMPTPLVSPGDPGSATVRRWAGEPRRLGFFLDEPHASETCTERLPATPARAQAQSPCLLGRSSPTKKWAGEPRRLESWPDSPLRSSEDAAQLAEVPAAGAIGKRAWPPLVCELPGLVTGLRVQNTFIHARLLPLTPVGDAPVRSHSVPKDVGSQSGGLPAAGEPPSRVEPVLGPVRPHTPRRPAKPTAAHALLPERARQFNVDDTWEDSGTQLTVRNTFLHTVPPPPTPGALRPAGYRSRSLPPPNLGRGLRGDTAAGQLPDCTLQAFPQLLQAIEGQCDVALAKGGRKLPAADALPAFVPLSPALTASPTECSRWFAATPGLHSAQHVVRLADHL
uniref:HTH OST-type domain-containing protein n=2 Tax=Pyrodinium bahamense TaxID=73915 RepID=A0A7S0A379_9DINO|mmetsp:Transcript_19788/g.54401  ORF Transcript_19788/g.54401 Transcript_19788/m.54401 type:complete len:848 (+) Transcript_19788:144-2687(+)